MYNVLMGVIVDSDVLTQISQKGKQNADLLMKVMNFDNFIFKLEQALRNNVFNTESQSWVAKGNPFMNNKGISKMIGVITSHIGEVNTITNFTIEEVDMICLMLGEDVIDALTLSYKDWGIKQEDLSLIYDMILNSIFAMLKGSENEGIRSLLRDVEKRETIFKPMEEKKGFLPSLTGGNK